MRLGELLIASFQLFCLMTQINWDKYLGSMLTNDVRVKINPALPWQSCIQQKEDSFYQHTGLKFEEETSKMLHLELGFVWC